MNRLLFCFRAIRNNIRTAPLAFVAIVWAIATAYAFEAWLLRMIYKVYVEPAAIEYVAQRAAQISFILFLFLLFMYNYWLKITEERNVPYVRMGAPRYVLFAESLLEMLLLVVLGSLLGYAFDCILVTIAPRSKYILYLDAVLILKTFGVVLIAPSIVLFGRVIYSSVLRFIRKRRFGAC